MEGSLTGPAFTRQWQKWEERAAQLRAATPGITDDAVRRRLREEVDQHLYWPVAILGAADRQLLGTQTQVVRLSDDTLLKQAVSRLGQDFTLQDYWRVQQVIEQASFVAMQGENVLVFVERQSTLYAAVVKRTRDGQELYLTSFRRSGLQDVARLRRQAQVLRDEIG